MSRLIALVVILLLLPFGGVVAAQDATPAVRTGGGDKILRIAQGTVLPISLDPQMAFDVSEIAVSGLDYEGLTRLDADLRTVPGAAESWEFNEDGTVLTFHLRPDLTYSDGSPLTAEDFRYAVERTCDPSVQAPYAAILFDIVGCEASATGQPATPAASGASAAEGLMRQWEAGRGRERRPALAVD